VVELMAQLPLEPGAWRLNAATGPGKTKSACVRSPIPPIVPSLNDCMTRNGLGEAVALMFQSNGMPVGPVVIPTKLAVEFAGLKTSLPSVNTYDNGVIEMKA